MGLHQSLVLPRRGAASLRPNILAPCSPPVGARGRSNRVNRPRGPIPGQVTDCKPSQEGLDSG